MFSKQNRNRQKSFDFGLCGIFLFQLKWFVVAQIVGRRWFFIEGFQRSSVNYHVER